MKKLVVVSLLLMCSCLLYGQASCYQETRSKGVALYNQGQYAKAQRVFSAAKQCPDKPKNNDMDTWIAKCKAQTQPAQAKEKEGQRAIGKQGGQSKIKQQISHNNYQTISGIEMVKVEGGTFTMGCTSDQSGDCDSDERPTHRVTVSTFLIGKYEVTQKLWKEIMGTNPSRFTGNDNRPVEQVSWNDVQEFLRRLNARTGKNYRLPTEAEWEFAARGGNQSQGYKYSGSNTIGNVAWYEDNANETTHPVGQKQPNELGIYDMSGNVYEWCSDWFGDYSSSAQTNPKGPSSGSYRVLRGGSWISSAKNCRVAYRHSSTPSNRNGIYGFRLVLSL